MFESDSESGSSSEEDHGLSKPAVQNKILPKVSAQDDETGESSQEEEVEEKINKMNATKRPSFKNIILECFHEHPNEKLSLKKIKSYAHTQYQITELQEKFLKLALKKLINDKLVKNVKSKIKNILINSVHIILLVTFLGSGINGSFKLVPQKPIKVKKVIKTKPTDLTGGKIGNNTMMTAEVYGSSTKNTETKENIKPKPRKKADLKIKTIKKDVPKLDEPKQVAPKKKEKAGPKKEIAGPKKEIAAKKPKNPTKEAPKKVLASDIEDSPKKKTKLVPKKLKESDATKKTTIVKKIPAKSTVDAIRKSIDSEKKKVAVARPKRKG